MMGIAGAALRRSRKWKPAGTGIDRLGNQRPLAKDAKGALRWADTGNPAKPKQQQLAATGTSLKAPSVPASDMKQRTQGPRGRAGAPTPADLATVQPQAAPPGQQLPMRPVQPADALARERRAAGQYVRTQGRTTGHEHLVAIDTRTGEVIARETSGMKSTVSLSQSLWRALQDAANKIETHHNHPSDRAPGRADVSVALEPGSATLWVHGAKGSVYSVTRIPGRRLRQSQQQILDEHAQLEGVASVALGKMRDRGLITARQADHLHYHLLLDALHNAGRITYTMKPGKELKALLEAHAADLAAARQALAMKLPPLD